MIFTKMNGAGNDFIIINNIEERLPEDVFPKLARTICERHLSIGADGLMVVCPPSPGVKADYRMLFINSDGSIGEMCGNGARCICRYGFDNGLAGEVQNVETMAGIVTGQRIDKRMYRIRLNTPEVINLDEDVEIAGQHYICSYVELGNPGIPHCIVEISGLREMPLDDLRQLGENLRNYKGYPKGANVNFYEISGDNMVYEVTYERGVEDFTYACGTGTGSVVAVLTVKGEVSGKNTAVDMKGGRLIIDIEKDACGIRNIYLTGPTNLVAAGEIFDENWRT